MAAKLCPKIILEGPRLTLKTEIAFALNEHRRIVGPRKYRYHSPLISAEWCAFTNHPWGPGLVDFEPQEQTLALETCRTWVRLFEWLRYSSRIVDRFHISTMLVQRLARGVEVDFGWLEDRLEALGFHLVFCARQPASSEQARRRRLLVSGNTGQYDNLDVFLREQYVMRGLVQKSRLPRKEIDFRDDDVNRAVEAIADRMTETGGLWARDQAIR